jgi:predicted KAP-like P-loop ATPase
LIILDDLDRLEPAELLLTFKLVRLVGRLPNVYYLLTYDERTLVDVLKRTDLVGEEDGRAQAYLEKMIQVRLDIPPLLDSSASTSSTKA